MFNRFVALLVLLPIAVVLIALAVANRHATVFTVDPFDPGNPALSVELPLYVYLFAALVLGMLIGSLATWFKQGRYRRRAREREAEAQKLRQAQARGTPQNAPQIAGPGA
ncbi:lipopolysaccharide assembly protein LapA domain-containing protein [Aquibium sp. A9E412]|uniref:lipopolysaccharide assembly protein LapA domain-containing protein n=1 Tax=Aquibium sp. A9E412 TaxID=2976767 RepID=UPI0025B23723|nr:lipopolysaccharide assembly protein LapA domain-containing protein [Aquibium sp. A9E412]MDN2568137.1 lipopolysaccharide assembly protein LapA domain-containing protein [Aquibium sp. A9E412]